MFLYWFECYHGLRTTLSELTTKLLERDGYEARKVDNRAQYFVLLSYTMHELRNQHVSIG